MSRMAAASCSRPGSSAASSSGRQPSTALSDRVASAMLAIDLAGRLLAADEDPDALALILAGEKAFTRDAQVLPGISVFGEAAAACLVRSQGPRDPDPSLRFEHPGGVLRALGRPARHGCPL